MQAPILSAPDGSMNRGASGHERKKERQMKAGFWNSRVTSLAAAATVVLGTSMWAAGQAVLPTNGQDGRGGIGGVREQDQAAVRTAARLNSGAQQNAALVQGQAGNSNDLLMRAGIVLDARNANRMIVERVIPNSPAAMSGLVPGDVITRVNGNPVTSLTAVAQALLSGAGNTLGLQVDRNGQSRQLNLTVSPSLDNSTRTAMRTDFGAPVFPNGQSNAATTIGGVPLPGTAAATTASGVTPGLGTTTAQSAGGQAVAAGQPTGVGQGTATAPGQAAGIATASGQLPTTTTGVPPALPGTPTSPSIAGNPTSPSLQVQSGGINQSFPGLNTSLPGVPTAAQGTTPSTIPSSQGTVNPAIGGGTSPTTTGAGTTGTGGTPATSSSQGTVNPSVGGGTSSATTGAIGAGATAPGASGATGTAGAGVSAATGGAAAGGTSGRTAGAGGAGTGGGAGGAGGGAAAGGT